MGLVLGFGATRNGAEKAAIREPEASIVRERERELWMEEKVGL